jgi:hypothetical protein
VFLLSLVMGIEDSKGHKQLCPRVYKTLRLFVHPNGTHLELWRVNVLLAHISVLIIV